MTTRATYGYSKIDGMWWVCTFDDAGAVENKVLECYNYDEAINTANGYNGGWLTPPVS